uniref:Uncharacterized protein n=1 Tax=Monodelphis domestica TaxID=13616 RepID=F7GLD1_MONDO
MFFERYLQDHLKLFIPGTTDPNEILDLVPLCKDYVVRLQVDQFLPPVKLEQPPQDLDQSDSASEGEPEELNMDHFQLDELVAKLHRLEELDLVFGVKDCGMNFEWNLFNFTTRDCYSLAATIKACHTLKVVKLIPFSHPPTPFFHRTPEQLFLGDPFMEEGMIYTYLHSTFSKGSPQNRVGFKR